MELRDLPVFFLDLQTTGSTPKNGDVLEIGWGQQNFKSYLVKQEKGFIPYHIQKLTGITEDDLKDSRDRADIILELKEYGSVPCVIHYAQFEIPFLQTWYEEKIPFPILCTHEIAKRLFPNLPTRSLKGLAGFFGYQKEELKRSRAHVEATDVIWKGLIPHLEKIGILTLEQLQEWLAQDFKKKKAKYEYPLAKEKRLNMSKCPGIYRMLNKSGEVLYVGKATSLHSRVNSYFRGQKNRDAKKLEMLTQVWDIRVTECKSPLEAALLETDEIKKINPPYNISLKANDRKLAFFSYDFSSYSEQQDEAHPIGPFPHYRVLDSIRNLSFSLKSGHFSSRIFYDTFPPELLEEGFNLFCSEHGIKPEIFKNIRSSLAFGLHLYRHSENTENMEEDDIDMEIETDSVVCAEDIAQKFKRHFIRVALSYRRAQDLTKLLNQEIQYPLSAYLTHTLYFQNGQQVDAADFQKKSIDKFKAWHDLTIIDYDRMSVLKSELAKLL